jgi:hypothetical protein
LKQDTAFRDAVSAQQWMRDSLVGLRSLDDGHTLRILARLPRERGGGN